MENLGPKYLVNNVRKEKSNYSDVSECAWYAVVVFLNKNSYITFPTHNSISVLRSNDQLNTIYPAMYCT